MISDTSLCTLVANWTNRQLQVSMILTKFPIFLVLIKTKLTLVNHYNYNYMFQVSKLLSNIIYDLFGLVELGFMVYQPL